MVKEKIIQNLKQAVSSIGINDVTIEIEHPSNLEFGDYSTNIPFKLSKQLKKSPLEIAEMIFQKWQPIPEVKKVDVVKPGFVNFILTSTVLKGEIEDQLASDFSYPIQSKKTILFEFGDPNTHKLPHVGHLFSYIYGESMARIMEMVGDQVTRVNYQGDIGLHVAKALWSYIKQKPPIPHTLDEKVKLIQKCYQHGATEYEKDEIIKKEIDSLNNQIYKKDPAVMKDYEETRKWSLDLYKELETELNIPYKRHYFESEVFESGRELVQKNTGTLFEKSEGAIIFDGEKYGLHKRVFINKHGNPTYEAKDMGLIQLKKNDFPFDLSLVTTASEQSEYWKVVIKASELLFPDMVGKLKHLGFGMINLTTGKMSSRTGQVINAVSLIDEVTEKIRVAFNIDDENLVSKVAMAAIKYSLLKSNAFTNIAFDIDKSISRDGDSGPYILYTYVRCVSILKKEKSQENLPGPQEITKEEENLLRTLYLLPEVSQKARHSYSPHFIATYLFDLAQKFNLFYQKHPILQSDKEIKNFRLFLTRSTSEVIKKGLYLLGIETVEKM